MPDISMCENKSCPSRSRCYRFTAKPSQCMQSYGDFEPKPGEDKCEFYWRLLEG